MSDVSIIKEEWLAERKYFGKNTHIYVGALRAFKLGAYRGIGIMTINDLATHLFANGDILKHNEEEGIPLKQFNNRTKKSVGSDKSGRYGKHRSLWI